MDDFKEMDRILWQVPIAFTKGEAKNHVCNLGRSRFKAWKQMITHFDPRIGAGTSVAYTRLAHPASQSGLTSTRPKTLWAARNIMHTWEEDVAEFEIKHANNVLRMRLSWH